MEADRFTGIVEVAQCKAEKCNDHLAAGWRLLAVVNTANWSKAAGEKHTGYVHKGVMYVVGRPAGVAPFDPEKADRSQSAPAN